MMLCDATSGLL